MVCMFTTKSITSTHNRAIMDSRILSLRRDLRSSMAPRPIDTVARMKGYEFWNMLSMIDIIADSLVPHQWRTYMWLTAVIHWFLSSGSINVKCWAHLSGLVSRQMRSLQDVMPAAVFESFRERSRRLFEATVAGCETVGNTDRLPSSSRHRGRSSKQSDSAASTTCAACSPVAEDEQETFGPYRRTLYNHLSVHLAGDLERYGPYPTFSANVEEHAQGEIAA